MDRHPPEQAPEGYWGASPLFTHHPEEDPYTSPPDAAHSHHHHHQRYSPWLQQPAAPQVSWVNESSEGIYPHQSVSGGSSGSPEASRRHPGTSPMGSPSLTSSDQDEYGRFVCKYPECDAKPEDRIFTRKSDWRRHFDKHTRPYRCPYLSCKDLAGFGWVGGLNRHLEELHNSKAQHKCPYTDCKRHTNGFSRSANLKNHMRKVHNVESDYGGSAAPSDTGEHSGAELDSPPPRSSKKPRGTQRTREQILREIDEVEREVVRRDEELRDARQRKMDVLVRLEKLRAELEDGRYPLDPCAEPTARGIYFSPATPLPPLHPTQEYSSCPSSRYGDIYSNGHGGSEMRGGGYESVSYCSSPPTPPSEPPFPYHPQQQNRNGVWLSPPLPSSSPSPWPYGY